LLGRRQHNLPLNGAYHTDQNSTELDLRFSIVRKPAFTEFWYLAPTRKAALAAYDQFISSYQTKFPKACGCLEKDKEVLFTFYDFPAQHWSHLRTTNPIESTFATVRLRTHRTKGCGSRIATLTMVFKLGLEAQKHWRRLNGSELLAKVVTGVKFVDGEEQIQEAA
jgi:transposase-like protein